MKQEDSYYFFNGGWRKFVEDQHLEEGDFLVFCFHGHSTFQVAAYDKSGCEKAPNLGGSAHNLNLIFLSLSKVDTH